MRPLSAPCIRTLLAVLLLALALSAQAEVKIELSGLDQTQRAAVIESLSLNRVAQEDAVTPARVRYLYARGEGEIRRTLQAFSHFSPNIESSLVRRGDDWVARYQVDPGPRARIVAATLENRGEGSRRGDFDAWLRAPELQVGAPLDQQAHDRIKTAVLEQAAASGYYDARFERALVQVDPATQEARIELILDTGPLYRVGEFRYTTAPVRQSLLARYQTLAVGDAVSTDQLLRMQRGLFDSGYFSSVEIEPHWDQADADQRIPIDVKLKANKRSAYRFGLGYGTDTGARLSASQNRRWVNDRGHRLASTLKLSELSNSLDSRYLIPGPDPLTDSYQLRGLYEEETTDSADTRKWSLGLEEQKSRGRHQLTYGLSLEEETFSIGSNPEQTTRLLVPALGWQWVRADNRLDPRRGYRLGAELSGGAERLLSDISFVQLHAEAKGVRALGDRWRLLARAEAGATAVSDFRQLPASRRFFAGGDSSVRGYAYRSLSPEDSDGDARGGRYLLVGSLELDYRVKTNWRGGLFWDTGNAFDSFSTALKSSLGVGVRWQSPIGPVRLDLAQPLDDAESVRLHFTLGPDL